MALTDGTSGRNMHRKHWAEPGLASECCIHQSKGNLWSPELVTHWSFRQQSEPGDGRTMDLLDTTHFPLCISHGHSTGTWVDRETV